MKVAELTGTGLNYWVAKASCFDPVYQHEGAEGPRVCINRYIDHGELVSVPLWTFKPSVDWSHGGQIVEREKINLECPRGDQWHANIWLGKGAGVFAVGFGPTALIAAMRAYVASRFGDEVPDEVPQ